MSKLEQINAQIAALELEKLMIVKTGKADSERRIASRQQSTLAAMNVVRAAVAEPPAVDDLSRWERQTYAKVGHELRELRLIMPDADFKKWLAANDVTMVQALSWIVCAVDIQIGRVSYAFTTGSSAGTMAEIGRLQGERGYLEKELYALQPRGLGDGPR